MTVLPFTSTSSRVCSFVKIPHFPIVHVLKTALISARQSQESLDDEPCDKNMSYSPAQVHEEDNQLPTVVPTHAQVNVTL